MTIASARPFVHVLLFECSHCSCPIPSAISSDHRSVENIDGRTVKLACGCGWSGEVPATDARRHWVDHWAHRDEALPPATSLR